MSASPTSDTMNEINESWNSNQVKDAFKRIHTSYTAGMKLDNENITNLTGVYPIEKVIEGKGDEDAYFLNERFVVLVGYINTYRILDLKSGNIYTLEPPVYPVLDKQGMIFFSDEYIYFIRLDGKSFVLFEFALKTETAKPLAKLPKGSPTIRYDDESHILQFAQNDYSPVLTIDLHSRKEIKPDRVIPERPAVNPVEVTAETGFDKIFLKYNDQVVDMKYPREEFLRGYNPGDLVFNDNNQNYLYSKSLWYPGLHILFNMELARATKVFIPSWMNIDDDTTKMTFIENNFYIWVKAGEDAGLYRINLNVCPEPDEIVRLLEEFKLVRQKSGGRTNEKA